jgi:hypothetical protein
LRKNITSHSQQSSLTFIRIKTDEMTEVMEGKMGKRWEDVERKDIKKSPVERTGLELQNLPELHPGRSNQTVNVSPSFFPLYVVLTF